MTLRFVVLALVALGGCILDDKRCDAHQVELDGDFALCVCEPNAVFNASGAGCMPCGENEVAQGGVCTCKEGFAKPSADAACMASSAGAACSASAPCSSAQFPYCVLPAGYCSKQGCTANADCPLDYSCESASDGRYCKRAPTGLNVPCSTDAECASFEANQCETLQQKTCILKGCATGNVTCPSEWACCDFSALLGSPLSICAAPAMLTNGSCPLGGMRVNP